MKQNIYKCKRLMLCVFIIVVVLGNSIGNIYSNPLADVDINYKDLQFNSNEGKLSIRPIDSGIEVHMNTNNLSNGYYTSYIGLNQEMDLGQYGALTFHINNKSEDIIKLNINFNESDKINYKILDGKGFLINKNNEELEEIKWAKYGTIEIPNDFEGVVFLPFKSFGKNDINNIIGSGLTIIAEENMSIKFEITNISLVEKNEAMIKSEIASSMVKGDEEVQIPTAGESIADYKIENSNSKIDFGLNAEKEGISITNEGRLIITPKALPENIIINILLNDKYLIYYNVNLIKSWTLNSVDSTGNNMSVPSEGELVNKTAEINSKLFERETINIIRCVLIVLAVGELIIYLLWKKKILKRK